MCYCFVLAVWVDRKWLVVPFCGLSVFIIMYFLDSLSFQLLRVIRCILHVFSHIQNYRKTPWSVSTEKSVLTYGKTIHYRCIKNHYSTTHLSSTVWCIVWTTAVILVLLM